MKNLLLVLFSFFVFVIDELHAQVESRNFYYDYLLDASGNASIRDLGLLPLSFENRASCALHSKKPARSIFILADGEMVSRTAHRLGERSGISNLDQFRRVTAPLAFRQRIDRITSLVHAKLLEGSLPLLPAEEDVKLEKFSLVNQQCRDGDCSAQSEYIKNIWHFFVDEDADRFRIDSQLLRQTKKFRDAQSSCYYLKEFSPLQAHLLVPKAGQESLTAVAKAYSDQQSLVTECSDPSNDLNNISFALLQEVNVREEDFNEIGFDYWFSFKTYVLWLWRQDYEIPIVSVDGQEISLDWLKDIDLSANIFLSPNSCASIEPPRCDSSSLALASLRDLAKLDHRFLYGKQTALGEDIHLTDHTRSLAKGLTHILKVDPKPPVNENILGFQQGQEASDWLRNFQKNIAKRKSFLGARFWQAETRLRRFIEELPLEKFREALIEESQMPQSNTWKKKFHYLCSEWLLSENDHLLALDEKLPDLAKLQNLSRLHPEWSEEKIQSYIDYYLEWSKWMKPICADVEKVFVQNGNPQDIDLREYRTWFLDYTENFLEMAEAKMMGQNLRTQALLQRKPGALRNSNFSYSCEDAVECSRDLIDSWITVFSVSQYADAFFKTRDEILSLPLFNPYKERTACGSYDPMKRTRNALKYLGLEMLNVALFSWNPSPFLMAFDIQEGEILSFDSSIEIGQFQYSANVAEDKTKMSLITQLGPLNGLSCQVVIGSSFYPSGQYFPISYFGLSGITLSYDNYREHFPATLESMQTQLSPETREKLGRSNSFGGGVGCQLYFLPVTDLQYEQLQESDFSSAKFGFGLLRSFLLFFQFWNHPDIPKSHEYDVHEIFRSYEINGSITRRCVKGLRKERSCTRYSCAEKVVDFMEENFGGRVTDFYFNKYSGRSIIHMSSCKGYYELDASPNGCINTNSKKRAMRKIQAFGQCFK